MINLHTRSRCDECDSPAVLQIDETTILCERCDRLINGDVENSDSSEVPMTDEYALAVGPSSPPAASAPLSDTPVSFASGAEPLPGVKAVAAASCVEHIDAVAAVTNSNSGDALGNLEPGSNISGGDIVATARSGRARDRAKSPAVAGIPLLDFESEIAALEADWARAGIIRNSMAFRVAARNSIIPNSSA